MMKKLSGDVWSTSIFIPDNPEARSQKKFKFNSQIDALTYGWEITNEVLSVAHAIIDEIPDENKPD